MQINPYISDILNQPAVIRETVARYAADRFGAVAADVAARRYDRIVLSGMGASHFAAYPAWLDLVSHGLPAWSVETAELLHHAESLVTEKSLLWLTSQSGASAEIVALIERLADRRPKTILATTADADSPLRRAADTTLQLHIGEESTVSTGSYVSTLAAQHLAVTQIAGGNIEDERSELIDACDVLQHYLAAWQDSIGKWERLIGVPQRLFVIGRGPSLAAVKTGSLIIKESVKFVIEGMSAAQFRHGPLELADEHLTVVILAGSSDARTLNERLAIELREYSAGVVWLDTVPHDVLPTVLIPALPRAAMPIAEIIPLQLLSLALAAQTGVEAGVFRRIGKVTRTL